MSANTTGVPIDEATLTAALRTHNAAAVPDLAQREGSVLRFTRLILKAVVLNAVAPNSEAAKKTTSLAGLEMALLGH